MLFIVRSKPKPRGAGLKLLCVLTALRVLAELPERRSSDMALLSGGMAYLRAARVSAKEFGRVSCGGRCGSGGGLWGRGGFGGFEGERSLIPRASSFKRLVFLIFQNARLPTPLPSVLLYNLLPLLLKVSLLPFSTSRLHAFNQFSRKPLLRLHSFKSKSRQI